MKIAIDIDNTVFTNNSIIYRFLNNRQHLANLEDTELKFDKVEKQEESPLYEDEQISVRLQQDLVKREGEIVYCEYCGCKNKRRDCRCHGCKAPLK